MANKPDVILKWDEYQRLMDLEEEVREANIILDRASYINLANEAIIRIKDNLIDGL